MIVRQYIKDFEKMGFGMFVHFGAYSQLGKGEWAQHHCGMSKAEYQAMARNFAPAADWAPKLVAAAKNAGCKYITITTRHHDGFSLYDTCGLNDYDSVHTCGRDLIREFVDACNDQGVMPFFYHTLIDWYAPDYPDNWEVYMKYLQRSVEILCTNYGTIGGLWFDGMWAHWDNDWEEDTLYGLIRRHQPNAMIINNTGMQKRGQLGHIELDSITFERGKPLPLNMEGVPKYLASEMCQIFNSHWGYAAEDLNYMAPAELIRQICDCRRCGSNMLLNVGPMADGYLRLIDAAYLDVIGQWVKMHDEAIRAPRPTDIAVEGKPNDFVLRDGNTYYLFCNGLPMMADENVQLAEGGDFTSTFALDQKILSATWLDNGAEVKFEQQNGKTNLLTVPFTYGRHLVVRVAKLVCEA